MDGIKLIFQVTALVTLTCVEVARAHGGMLEPPMRSVAWKYGFDTPVNYDWMSLYCGGLNNFTKNNGKCGLCGDPYDGPIDNDKGGIYDTGIIVRHYPAGLREIEVKVEVTAHHKGHFQFKLCPNNAEDLTQSCLDRYPLMIREGRLQGDPTRYFPPKSPKLNELHVLLPEGVICDRCVLQWTYTAGNNIGRDIQETFVNCADISIGGTLDSIPVQNKRPTDGAVVVIEQRPDISNIIDQAPPGSVNEVLTALTNTPDANVDVMSGHAGRHNDHHAPGAGGDFRNREQPTWSADEFQPRFHNRWNNNRDPRMMIPPQNEFGSNFPDMANGDAPGLQRDNRFDFRGPTAIGPDGLTGNWNRDDRFMGHGQFGPNTARGSFSGQFTSPFPPQHPFTNSLAMFGSIIPPPSRATFTPPGSRGTAATSNEKEVFNDKGPHTSLLGSVGSVIGQINPNNPNGRFADRHQNPRSNSLPSPQFVNQMNEIRRTFPRSHDWRRADGMISSRHAVRNAPHADTHDFSTGEIRQLVPSLPTDIGPRNDISSNMDPRFHPGRRNFRENWFPRSRDLMQNMRMRQAQRRQTRLPRRIEVETMAIAQHLLRKYPQLRGRVFLSRRGHLRNQFSHMVNKYARRQNVSRVK